MRMLTIAWISRVFIFAAIVGWASSVTFADEPEDLAPEVRRLVRGLNDRELSTRDTAEAGLVELGPKILDLLPETNERMPAEVKHRLGRIRENLQRVYAEEALKPTKLSLDAKGMPLAEVLAKAQEQSGNELIDMRQQFGQVAEDTTLDVNLNEVEFWPAIDRMLDQAGLDTYHYTGKRGLGIVARGATRSVPRERTASYAGPFRLEATTIEATRDLKNPANDNLRLTIEVAWEPRLAPIAVMQSREDITATSAEGEPIEIAAIGVNEEKPVQEGVSAVELTIPFELPGAGVTKIASLKGTLNALVPGREATFRFEDLSRAKGTELRQGSTVVAIDEVRKNNALWEVFVRVAFDKASGALESHRGWIENNPCYVEDTEGNQIAASSYYSYLEKQDERGFAYLFELPAGPQGLTLIYKSPATIVSAPIKYELTDIELP